MKSSARLELVRMNGKRRELKQKEGLREIENQLTRIPVFGDPHVP